MTTLNRDLRMAIRQALAKHAIDNLQLEMDIAASVRPFVVAKAQRIAYKRGDLVDYYADATHNPELLKRLTMRQRVDTALRRNIDWEDVKSEWDGFDKWLVEQEKEGRTIESFIKWYKEDNFRAKGIIYLNPRKIKDWWLQAPEQKHIEQTGGAFHG